MDFNRTDVIYSLRPDGQIIRDVIYECQQQGHEGSPCHMPFTPNNELYDIQFCTGLKDKNGKLIYEGDIVKLYNDDLCHIHSVKFGDFAMYDFDFQEDYEKGSTAVYGWYLGGLQYPIPLSISLDTSGLEIEVVGNIYENPELLE